MDRPRPVKILRVERECKSVWSIEFEDEHVASASPGQFIMAYLPGLDEIPLSVSDVEGSVAKIAVKAVGDCTRALCGKKAGEAIGVRGPYGKGFELFEGSALLVGGGVGAAPLLFLARMLSAKCSKVKAIIGAPTGDELLFLDALSKHCVVLPVTEDGSAGEKGSACDLAEREIAGGGFDHAYVCGPEPMMAKIVKLCASKNVHVQASLERWFKCAVGLCGSCVLDKLGLRVCADGPVFSGDQLAKVDDFGRFCRSRSGSKVAL
ncbi:MAG: dihydroorotate dehydrogenase electron transfer subunit [Candidatus Brockarchaeota archaeon]|nr:dihydroorotate dehydrogenase electron transfer subunit [Candidatus Brockarchaeota archaeon]